MRMRLSHTRLVAVIFIVGSSCGVVWSQKQVAKPKHAATTSQHPNVVLITLDTVRADRLGCYGAKNVATPTLDALAQDGVLFERAIAQVPLTWPSHAVILTGLYPFQNGVQDFTGQPLDARFRTVAQAFKANGYRTGAVISSFALDQSWGLARGFDSYDDAFSQEAYSNRELGLVERKAGESVDHALTWLRKPSTRPFFFWLHLYDAHSPYSPPEPFSNQYVERPYDGEIAYVDHELARVIFWLKAEKLYDKTTIVVVSDHGESLGEHGEREHGFFVYNSTVHVPLIIKPERGSRVQAGRVIAPVETVAMAPTLLQLAGIKDALLEKQFQSASLLAPGTGSVERPAYSETFYPTNAFGWSPLHALETNRYHYIDAPSPELYDVIADPEESKNIYDEQKATSAVLKEKLSSLVRTEPYSEGTRREQGISADAAEKLSALGYVASRMPVSEEALARGLPDPKDKITEFNAIMSMEEAFHKGEFDRAMDLAGELRKKDPRLYIVPFYMAQGAMMQQDWQRAADSFRECLELNPGFDQAMTGLSRALIFLGKLDEGKSWAEKALNLNPQNYRALYQLGFVETSRDKDKAIQYYEKAVAIQGSFAPLRRDLGLLQLQKQNYSEAIKHLSKAVELGINDAGLYNYLGMAYSRTGKFAKAIENYQTALELNPKLAATRVNLAGVYERMNRPKEAAAEYKAACQMDERFCEVGKTERP
jgi:arylsulfatase A-like enzyme/Tfp pilus assembly protein PilF